MHFDDYTVLKSCCSSTDSEVAVDQDSEAALPFLPSKWYHLSISFRMITYVIRLTVLPIAPLLGGIGALGAGALGAGALGLGALNAGALAAGSIGAGLGAAASRNRPRPQPQVIVVPSGGYAPAPYYDPGSYYQQAPAPYYDPGPYYQPSPYAQQGRPW